MYNAQDVLAKLQPKSRKRWIQKNKDHLVFWEGSYWGLAQVFSAFLTKETIDALKQRDESKFSTFDATKDPDFS